MAMDCLNITALHQLLTVEDENSDSEDEKPSSEATRLGPGDIGPKHVVEDAKTKAPDTKKNNKDIWDSEDVQSGAEFDDVHDPRPQPEYDIIYKQAVTSEDMFLQMGNKTPATSSCEDMLVKVQLPDTKIADVKLDVQKKFLDVRTPKFKLGLHLPHPVDHKNGKAQWDGNKHLLSVTLHMAREYDFMNY